ncbi:cysteine-rich receptor-like protein kinase 15 isoform X2 [Ipomoea triloba]|uniref:cysteine-rich receptor-like protein kinase 15 isoform X2 n=1 Tax=Ipomoea triloba TaxID=35885 RepID=UPI00125E674E|nr:cysteine-rich receptor-like protein kinase 15 isoform X2 [Ipomoea triloba]
MFSEDLTNMVDRLRQQAADGGPFLKYAANSSAGPDLQTIYAYVQCTPDLSHQDCTDCLSTAFTLWYKSNGNGKIGARVLCPSCFFHYENSSFFGATLIKVPPSAPPPPSPPSHRIAIVIVVSTATGLIMITICIFLMQKRKAKSYAANVEESSSGDEISPVEYHLKYELITIQTATDNFSKANKVGEGRFGAVYKGKLENRQLVAVKRLSENSRQVNLELKNEMALMARLQHRNLVRLLGYCLDGRTEILVYDFVPNGGLDSILFDPVKRGCLDWGRRYKIIESIARGLAYLHEGSHHRIIHCNLKASNILLDVDLNPKIADFGMARLFALDKTHGSTSAIMGTYGYIAPEYALYSQFSVKSDVYSFGVLVLEIISGQKSSNFQNGESIEDLLSYAWTHFKSGAASNVIDPMLRAVSSPVHEITKCIHIALLCVQESVVDRPTMFEVLQMLSNLSMSLPVPLAPGFFIDGNVNTEASSQFTKSEMSNSSDQYPRKMQKSIANSYAKISALESLKYDFNTITDNFSEANLVGIGTLGPVYKCKLENGLEVVAKRCSENSWLGRQEFKNEVSLLAKLQHRNFVRLLGSCQEGKEMLLVYEFVPNGGLDQFLFDPIKRGYLDWGRRYKIIESIARGLVYLHEDSNLRIIHRNLTVSNVLLDADLNPKISNFSLAWLFTSDKTHGSTDQIAGTYEYMAPEYSSHGQFSVRSDVYSFGVLALEIISGQKHGYFQNGESIKSLPSYAWTHWKNGSSLNVIDPMLRGVSSPVPDIIKCIQVALLCVQENVEDRPTMGEVVQMLSNLSTSFPVPSAPPFVIPSRVNSDASINEMSISDDDEYAR